MATKIFDMMTSKQFSKEHGGEKHIAICVKTKMDVDVKSLEDVVFYKLSKRGTRIFIGGFENRDGILQLSIAEKIHDSFSNFYDKKTNIPIAMTFADFCWVISDGTTSKSLIEVSTPIEQNCTLGDLTWVLPSKFADDVIEAMHSLNVEILDGIMNDSILYGPLFLNVNKE